MIKLLTCHFLVFAIMFAPVSSHSTQGDCARSRNSLSRAQVQACQIALASNPECRHIPRDEKKTCGADKGVGGTAKDIAIGCLRSAKASVTQLLSGIWTAVKWSAQVAIDAKFRKEQAKGASQFLNTTAQVLGNEYVRAKNRYLKQGPLKRFAANTLAAIDVGNAAFALIYKTVRAATLQYKSKLSCMNARGVANETCATLVALLIPTSAGLFTLLKHGPKAFENSKVIAQLTKNGIIGLGRKELVQNANKVMRPDQRILYQISRMGAAQRSGPRANFLTTYKNDPRFAEWLKTQKFDTEEPTYFAEEALERYAAYTNAKQTAGAKVPVAKPRVLDLKKSKDVDKPEWNASLANREFERPVTGREVATLDLRNGDKVKGISASGKEVEIEIGEFIGSGNTTHIFDVKNSSVKCPPGIECVVRMPFYTNVIDQKAGARQFNKIYAESIKKYEGIEGVQIPKLVDHGKNFEYLVVEKIKNAKPMTAYIDEIQDLATLHNKKGLSVTEDARFQNLLKMFDEFEPKAQEIAKRSGSNARLSAANAADNVDAIYSEARQVLVTQDSNGKFIYHLVDVE